MITICELSSICLKKGGKWLVFEQQLTNKVQLGTTMHELICELKEWGTGLIEGHVKYQRSKYCSIRPHLGRCITNDKSSTTWDLLVSRPCWQVTNSSLEC